MPKNCRIYSFTTIFMVLGKKEIGDYLGTIIYKYKENIPNHLLSFYLVQSKDFPKPWAARLTLQ